MLAGRNDEAIELGRQTLAMAEPLGLADIRAHALNNIGTARTAKGDLGGLADLEASIATANEANAQRDAARGWINLSSMSYLLGDLRRAREQHDRGMEVSERHGLGGQQRWLRGSLPVLLYHSGRWDEALRAADDFIAEVEAGVPHYQEMETRDVRSSIRLARGDIDGALDDSAKSLAMARGAKDPQALHPAVGNRARILFQTGYRAGALALMEELLGIVSAHGHDLTMATWFVSAAFVLGAENRGAELIDLAEAAPSTLWIEAGKAIVLGNLAEAAETFAAIGSRTEEAFARLREAERLIAAGGQSEAEVQLGRALAFYREARATAHIGEAEALLASRA
jgi:tetratricopeptide (TPR) repeat protein